MPFDIPKLVRKDTAPFTFTFPGKTITLHTRPLTLETREVFNDAFRERGEAPAARDKYDERLASRAENIEKLARLCVASWEGVDAECTPDNVLALLKEIDGLDEQGRQLWRDPANGKIGLRSEFPQGTRLETVGWKEEITAYTLWAQNPLNFRAPLVEASKVGEG